jgi:hypothetical protein
VERESGRLGHQFGHGGPAPWRGEVELPPAVGKDRGAEEVPRRTGHQLFEDDHGVGVVGIGLIELERRELGVVPGRDSLVAKTAADLEHLVEAADDQSLQVELGGDPQIEIGVEGVVMRDERARRGTAGDRMEDRRLHLDKALRPQSLPHALDHIAAQHEQLATAIVGPQVDLALAVAGLHIGHPAPLVAERAAGVGQEHPLGHLDRELAPLGADHLAPGPDPIAQVEADERVELGRLRGQGEELNGAAGVAQLAEGHLPLCPQQHESAGHCDVDPGLVAGLKARPRLDHFGRLVGPVESVRYVGLGLGLGLGTGRGRGLAHEPLLETLRS